ncbi:MAG: cation diffusion facilitator family transporter [Erysipelotrichaceae bacterium]|nr:cation diffusion facilitator family transporter [Erysipelotrichaceae bacterium]
MEHDHDHQGRDLKVAFLLNFTFTIIELFGGMMTNSMAVFSDALHDLGDSLSLAVAWGLEKYAHKAPDYRYSYGYARFSLLGALINSLILIFGSLAIIYNSFMRLKEPAPVDPLGMIFLAVLGIAVNGLATWRLHKGESLNEKVVSWHLIEDVLGWVVVLIGSVVMYYSDLAIIDPLLSLGITIFVMVNVVFKLLAVLRIFLEGVPLEYSIASLKDELERFNQVINAHHIHLWSLEGKSILASFHLVVADDTASDSIIDLKKQIRKELQEKGIEHITIEIDYNSEAWQDHQCD